MKDPFRFDDTQLEQLLSSLRRPNKPAWGLERALLTVQLTAIILAGFWSLHTYLSYEREHQKLTIRKETLEVAASEVSQETRLKFTNIDFSVRVLQSFPDESNLYRVQFTVTAENIGQSNLEVSASIIQVFLGGLAKELQLDSIANINPPPSPFGDTTPGDVTWQLLECKAFSYRGSKYDPNEFLSGAKCENPSPNGGVLTSSLKSGEYSYFSKLWNVRARSDKIAAVTLDVGVDGGNGKGNRKFVTKWMFLSEAEKPNK
jgi:hypothetical protein